MGANALVGILCLEFALGKTKKHRKADEERDKNYPAFRRYDAPKWSRWRLYPVAVTIMPLRLLTFVCLFISCGISLSILTFGLKGKDPKPGNQRVPIPAWRKWIIQKIIKWHGLIFGLCIGMTIKVTQKDVDYAKWLGPDYKSAPKPLRCSTFISNHCGLVDGFTLPWALNGDFAFAAGAFVKNIPIVGNYIVATEGLFVPRSGNPEDKQKFVDGMAQR